MGSDVCGCSGPTSHHKVMNMENEFQQEARRNIKAKIPVVHIHKKKTRRIHIQREQNSPNINDSNYSNQSFDAEFYRDIAKATPVPYGSYRFLIYIENNFIDNKLVYGYMRSLEMMISVPWHAFLNDIMHQYCCLSNKYRLICVSMIVLQESMNMTEVKKSICNELNDQMYIKDINSIRLRQIWSRKQELLTKAYCDGINLKENCKHLYGGMGDNIRICCQQITEAEQCRKDHVILRCAKVYRSSVDNQWYTDTFCDTLFNVITMGDMEYIDISSDDLMIQHHAYHNFNKKWIDYYVDNHRWGLTTTVRHDISSGDILLFIDKCLMLNRQTALW